MSSSIQNLHHLKIPLEDILEATDHFSDENFIRQGGFGKIYKGNLKRSGELINIVARRLDSKHGQGSKQFMTEILMLSKLEHENIVSLVGFGDEKNEKIVINKYEAKGSLDNYITDPSITWGKRLHICVGIANALRYIYYDEKRDLSVVHRNIKSSKILLDYFFVPKLSGFELSMTSVASQRDRLCVNDPCGTVGYVDPTYIKTCSVSHKSDIYSLGVVLFEVLLGKKAITNNRDTKLAQEAKSHYVRGKLDDLINPVLWKQMNEESLKNFSETAYACLNEDPEGRPDINQVVLKLKKAVDHQREHANRALRLQWRQADPMPETQESGSMMMPEKQEFSGPMEELKIPLKDIREATNYFSNENFIRQGGFGKIYKGKLWRSGGSIDIVARRLDTKYGQGSKEFWTEVSMLAKLKHENLVSLIGFCDEKNEKIVVNKYEAKESLDEYLTDRRIGWTTRLRICVGIAHALRFIHYDVRRDYSVIHRNIKSSKVLLDNNYEPKLAGFNLSTTTVASQRDRLCVDDPCGSVGYVDPTYAKTGTVTYKSDIYSFGVVLYEVLFSKNAITDKRDIELAKKAKSRYENEDLRKWISPNLRKQMYGKSLELFSEIAYDCLNDDRASRPSINEVVKKLKKALDTQLLKAAELSELEEARDYLRYQKPNCNPKWERSRKRELRELTSELNSERKARLSDWKGQKHYGHLPKFVQEEKNNLQISLADIKSATQDFSPVNLIGKGGFGQVYKGKLRCAGGHQIIAAKRLGKTSDQGEIELKTEIAILSEFKHTNVIDLLSYCNENGEKVIVYGYASKGSLDNWLKSNKLTWKKRLVICIDILRGLNFLHGTSGTSDVKQDVVIHRDIKSANILLHDDWKASIADFGLSLISPLNQDLNYVIDNVKGTRGYCDPIYMTTGFLTKESDIYSVGVLLFEMLCGRLVIEHNSMGAQNLVDLVRHHFEDGTLYEMVFEATKKHMAPKSLTIFQNIAYQCIHEERSKRPTAYDVLIQLKNALEFQDKWEDLNTSLDNIMLDTNNFSHDNLIDKGDFWSVYKGRVTCVDGCKIIAAKRLDRQSAQRETERLAELEVILEYTHENIISLVGHCDEKREKITIYEYSSISKGSLDRWLKYDGLTWRKRLEICIDIARGLAFLHGTSGEKQDVVIHGDIKSTNVLLNDDWKAIIANFGCSLISPSNQKLECVVNNARGTVLTKESDIYSFGVLLFEMLCGRLVMEHNNSKAENLVHMVRRHYKEGSLYEIVFDAIKKQMAPKSFTTFLNIAYQCIHDEEISKRPNAYDVLIQLQKALEPQDKWEDLNISLNHIMLDTQDFSHDNLIDKGDFWSVYKGRVTCADGCEIIAAKRLDRRSNQREAERMAELAVLLEYTHENIISLVGHCDEEGETITVYKYTSISKGSLDKWLKRDGLTWRKRLEICIDIARGLAFLHGTSGAKQDVVIHGDIKSSNVLLNDDRKAIIAGFGCSLISPINQEMKYVAKKAKGTQGYCDPLYTTNGVLTKESDIYSFGVLLFEMLCGRFVMENNSSGAQNLVDLVRRSFVEGTLYQMVFDATKKHMAPKSLTAFLNIAYQCLHEERSKRPTANDVLIQLKKSLELQAKIENLNMSLDDIMLATQDFSLENLIGEGVSGPVYKGKLTFAHGCEIIAAKHLNMMSDERDTERITEVEVLLEYKHENIIALLGRCNEKREHIMVYEYISKGSLDRWLNYDRLTWRERLEICIDMARGLTYLHGTSGAKQEVVIHRDIKSKNVLVDGDWKAKIANFGCSLIIPVNQEMKYVVNNAKGTPGYCDPLYTTTGVLTKESDIYSFGVLLFEMLCGRFVTEHNSSRAHNLVDLVRDHFAEGKLSQMVFEAIKKEIVPESLTTFQNIAYKCLFEERVKRPTASDVLIQLTKALEFQVETEIWEPKIPRDFGKIIQMTSSPETYYFLSNKDICTSLHNGFLLRENKVWFSLGIDGRRVEMISAIKFHFRSYFGPDNWIPIPESRFGQVAWIADSSMMYMHFNIKAHLLSPGVNYGVNLLFKFCDPRENSDTSIDLEYHIGNKYLRSHCTTERVDGWLTKELFQFSSLAEEPDIDIFLLGFSGSHYVNRAVYIEGIEFQAINNMTHEEMEELKRVIVANVRQSPIYEGHWKVNMAEVQELPANESGNVFAIVPWLLEKCCG